MEIKIENISELPQAASEFIEAIGEHRVIAFHAPMGAGKTTFIAEVCRQLGVDADTPNSPTFAIINHYEGTHGDIYHFDMYRLESPEQAFDIGAEDFLYSGALCLIEWPENAKDILPPDTLHVNITIDPDTQIRTLTL